jgi:hypothetical protein
MLSYANARTAFKAHLGEYYAPPDILDGTEGLNRHMYLGHLLYEMVEAQASDDFRHRVVALVENLHMDGDDLCKELVHVSFFENMDHLSRQDVEAIRVMFSSAMRKVMDDAFRQLGYAR